MNKEKYTVLKIIFNIFHISINHIFLDINKKENYNYPLSVFGNFWQWFRYDIGKHMWKRGGLNSGLHTCEASTRLPLSPIPFSVYNNLSERRLILFFQTVKFFFFFFCFLHDSYIFILLLPWDSFSFRHHAMGSNHIILHREIQCELFLSLMLLLRCCLRWPFWMKY